MRSFFSPAALLTISTALGCLVYGSAAHAQSDPEQELIQQGRYISEASDCMACHTAKNSDTPFSGGLAISTPVGKIISSNITPSKEFGIGKWSEKEFAAAVRRGKSPTLGHLYPAMPYTAYSGMSDRDVHALYVYFMKAVKPVEKAPEHKTKLSFPFNIRFAMVAWNMLYGGGQPMTDSDSAPGAPKRGEYLVKALAHCGTCHTPRNSFMAEDNSRFLAGNPNIQGWTTPNITSDQISGMGGWSDDEIVTYLKNGAVHGKAQAAGPMAEAVEFSLRHLTDQDLKAIATYIKSVKPIRDPKQTKPNYGYTQPVSVDSAAFDYPVDRSPQAMATANSVDGQELYLNNCATCHQTRGQGTKDQFYPSLTSNSVVGAMDSRNLIMTLLHGVDRHTNDGHVFMPGFKDKLTEEQIASIAQYVTKNFGNPDMKITVSDVHALEVGAKR